MVDVLDDAISLGCGDAKIVEHGEMLDIFAETDSAGMRTDRDAEFCREKDDREVFVDSGDPATVDLTDVDGSGLQELLEHDAVVAVFAGRDADGRDFAANAGVAEDVVRIGGFFHPPWVEGAEGAGAFDSFDDAPLLVGVDHEAIVGADLFADDPAAAEIVSGTPPTLSLKCVQPSAKPSRQRRRIFSSLKPNQPTDVV